MSGRGGCGILYRRCDRFLVRTGLVVRLFGSWAFLWADEIWSDSVQLSSSRCSILSRRCDSSWIGIVLRAWTFGLGLAVWAVETLSDCAGRQDYWGCFTSLAKVDVSNVRWCLRFHEHRPIRRSSQHSCRHFTDKVSSHLGVRVVADKCADGSLEPSPDGFNKSLHRA